MKKGRILLLVILILSFGIVTGIFIGRNTKNEGAMLSADSTYETTASTEADLDEQLDINTATFAQLMELPGIGQVLAERIIAYREANGDFQIIDEVMNVEGIGQKKFAQIESLIKVGG